MPIVHNVIQGPDGEPIAGATVTVTLVAGPNSTYPGFTAGATIEGVATLVTDALGAWFVDLVPNEDITPAGTYYRIVESPKSTGQRYPYTVSVPADGGPYNVLNVLVAEPLPPDPRVPVGGGSGGAVDSVDGRTGVVTLNDRYAALVHNHNGVYSPVGHNHDGAYSAIGHNHDSAYSAIGHNHDGTYATAGHTHTPASIGAATSGHTHTPASLGAAAASHTHTPAEAGAAAAVHSHVPADIGAAASAHTHPASDIVSGTLGIARIPTGTSGSTVALGNHTHAAGSGSLPDGIVPISGYWTSAPNGPIGSNLSLAVGEEILIPVPVDADGAIAALSVEVAVAGAAGAKIRLGVRVGNSTTRRPGAASLVLDAGQVDSTSTGAKTITLGTALPVSAGTVYWVSVTAQSAACTVRATAANNPYIFDSVAPSGSANSAAIVQMGVTGALPTDFTFFASEFAPRIGVKWQ